jgi:hypothetical protein
VFFDVVVSIFLYSFVPDFYTGQVLRTQFRVTRRYFAPVLPTFFLRRSPT